MRERRWSSEGVCAEESAASAASAAGVVVAVATPVLVSVPEAAVVMIVGSFSSSRFVIADLDWCHENVRKG
jgi:hypothetical protein